MKTSVSALTNKAVSDVGFAQKVFGKIFNDDALRFGIFFMETTQERECGCSIPLMMLSRRTFYENHRERRRAILLEWCTRR